VIYSGVVVILAQSIWS